MSARAASIWRTRTGARRAQPADNAHPWGSGPADKIDSLSSAISLDPRAPARLGPVGAVARAIARPPLWVDVLVIALQCLLYDATTKIPPQRQQSALENAWGILHLEQALHIDPELALDRWLGAHRALALLVSDYYDIAHFVVTLGVLGFVWWRRSDLYRPLRNSLVLVNLLGFLVFWRYPVAPPRMLTSAGFTDVVAGSHAFGSWHGGALASHANQLAAMPSLHIAWAAWSALALWRISERRLVRALGVCYPCLTAVAVMATGNHFLADIAAGALVLAVSVLAVEAPRRLLARRRRTAAPPSSETVRSRIRAPLRRAPAAARRRGGGVRVGAGGPAYLMSQTCYEVADQID
jgi:hypothetical protein